MIGMLIRIRFHRAISNNGLSKTKAVEPDDIVEQLAHNAVDGHLQVDTTSLCNLGTPSKAAHFFTCFESTTIR